MEGLSFMVFIAIICNTVVLAQLLGHHQSWRSSSGVCHVSVTAEERGDTPAITVLALLQLSSGSIVWCHHAVVVYHTRSGLRPAVVRVQGRKRMVYIVYMGTPPQLSIGALYTAISSAKAAQLPLALVMSPTSNAPFSPLYFSLPCPT